MEVVVCFNLKRQFANLQTMEKGDVYEFLYFFNNFFLKFCDDFQSQIIMI